MRDTVIDAVRRLMEAASSDLPIILVLGQSSDRRSVSQSNVLTRLLSRVGAEGRTTWCDVFSRSWTSEDVEWLSERFDRAVPSEQFAAAMEFPWSAVFTSSIDPKIFGMMSTRGRQPEAVLAAGAYARVPRSRSRPPVYYLFGKVDETFSDWSPPKKVSDLVRRTQLHTAELMNRIAETATASGIVVIAGLSPGADWLDIGVLLASLSGDGGPLVLFFGNSAIESPIADEMRAEGRLLEVCSDLEAVFVELEGALGPDYFSSITPDEPGRVTTPRGPLNITPGMRLRVEASASIVDDEWTSPPSHLNDEELKEAFRRFHGDLGAVRNRVRGIAREFAIVREFEERLWRSVEQNVERLSVGEGLLVLYGQSGTGKSIALARLAHVVRKQRKLPVLIATNRLPNFADVEGFCDEVERVGAEATIIICDANLPAERYRDLSAGLKSRGRRAVVVGSSYESDAYESRDELHFVQAPPSLSSREVELLRKLVGQPWLRGASNAATFDTDSNALAMLYRHLSPGRAKLASGLTGEARHWEKVLRERSKVAPKRRIQSSLASQLIDLGLAKPNEDLFELDSDQVIEGADAVASLVDYVMVTGRLNCPVPLNLLMRVLRAADSSLDLHQVAHLFGDLDLFRWRSTGEEGAELSLAPRLQIEAELICRRRVADVQREIELLVELIRSARANGVDSHAERLFLLDLLQKLDRDGPRRDAYRLGYLVFADALQELRVKNGVFDASLMLRESVFRRQAVWSMDGSAGDVVDLSERLPILEEARSTVEEAISLIDSGALTASKRTRMNLAAERASIYGYLAVQRFKNEDIEGSWSDYLAARIASAKAIAISDGYHPIDIALWTSSDMLRSDRLTPERKSEIVAELYATLDLVDATTLRESQRARFHERRAKVAALIGDARLGDEAIAALEVLAPATATYLIARARAESFLLDDETRLSAAARSAAAEVARFLRAEIERKDLDDTRCQRLLLQCEWGSRTGERVLRVERGSTPWGTGDIRDTLGVVRRLNELTGASARNQERYLEAVLTWLAGDFAEAAEIWHALSKDSEYEDKSRIVRRLVMTDRDGEPLRVSGRIESGTSERIWRIRLKGLNTVIPMSEHEFASEDLSLGREVRDFGVAFNYVGPIADPLTRTQRRR